jgi:Ca2+-binding EF-hand superfamily protein
MILQELRDAFNLFDTQHTGEIDAKELKVINIREFLNKGFAIYNIMGI